MPAVLITGANRGIGLEFVRQYTADGWAVFAACRDPKDDKFLELAVNGRADVIVSGDADLGGRMSIPNDPAQTLT